jgi:hypothetical protein
MRAVEELWQQPRQYPPRWIFQVELHLRAYAGALRRVKAVKGTLCVIRHRQAC